MKSQQPRKLFDNLATIAILIVCFVFLVATEGTYYAVLTSSALLLWATGSFVAIGLVACIFRQWKKDAVSGLLMAAVATIGLSAFLFSTGAALLLYGAWGGVFISLMLYLPGLLRNWLKQRKNLH